MYGGTVTSRAKETSPAHGMRGRHPPRASNGVIRFMSSLGRGSTRVDMFNLFDNSARGLEAAIRWMFDD